MGEQTVGSLDLFYVEALVLMEAYPKLSLKESGELKIISGEIVLEANESTVDSYSVEIHPTLYYPLRFPNLFEVGGKIPKNVDWHVFETDGHCCIKTQSEEILICKSGITLLDFVDNQIIPYLFNQTYRRLKGYFVNERSHGFKGDVEFFEQTLKTKSLLDIINWLLFILKRDEPNRVSKCFCGQNKYRNCHREAYRRLIIYSDNELMYFIKNLIQYPQFAKDHPAEAIVYSKNLT